MFKLQIEKKADRMLRSLDAPHRRQIAEDIYALQTRFMDGKHLSGALKGCRSWRSGDYRIIYDVHVQKNLIQILKIGHRREVYKSS